MQHYCISAHKPHSPYPPILFSFFSLPVHFCIPPQKKEQDKHVRSNMPVKVPHPHQRNEYFFTFLLFPLFPCSMLFSSSLLLPTSTGIGKFPEVFPPSPGKFYWWLCFFSLFPAYYPTAGPIPASYEALPRAFRRRISPFTRGRRDALLSPRAGRPSLRPPYAHPPNARKLMPAPPGDGLIYSIRGSIRLIF